MTFRQAIVLGIVQGLSEFLPISSSAHLILVPWMMGWPDQGLTFDIILHAATLFAILSFFWRDYFGIVLESLQPSRKPSTTRPPGQTMLLILFLGTVPASILGVMIQNIVATHLRNPGIISFTLIILALFLWLAERRATLSKRLDRISLIDALYVGMAQALALIPGISRSGITITAGLFRGMTRESAARFSFLLSAPIVLGASLSKLQEMLQLGIPRGEVFNLLIGFLTAFVVGYITIKYFIRFLQKKTLYLFIYYRILLGIAILITIQLGGLKP